MRRIIILATAALLAAPLAAQQPAGLQQVTLQEAVRLLAQATAPGKSCGYW